MRRGVKKKPPAAEEPAGPSASQPSPTLEGGPWDVRRSPFPVLSPERCRALPATLTRDAGADKGRVLYDLASLSAVSQGASFPGIDSLISSIGFNSSAGSVNVIFNTLEGSLSRRYLFHHLCPSGAHFKLAEHHLLGKQ